MEAELGAVQLRDEMPAPAEQETEHGGVILELYTSQPAMVRRGDHHRAGVVRVGLACRQS